MQQRGMAEGACEKRADSPPVQEDGVLQEELCDRRLLFIAAVILLGRWPVQEHEPGRVQERVENQTAG